MGGGHTGGMLKFRSQVAVVLAFLGSAGLPAGGGTPDDPYSIVQGMIVSCYGWGAAWGTDDMVRTLGELKELGVNWVAIHPYAGIRADGSVVKWKQAYADMGWLTRPIAEAHRLGLKIMIKPHLAYWGSPFTWRGAIAFDSDEQWQRFFSEYTSWIAEVAEVSADADAFVVGTELDKTIRFESEWRRIIAAVRERTSAPLTYSANWPEYRKVKFWDALDVIGIQAYFPLADHDQVPEQSELERAWAGILADLGEYARSHDRRVLFAELGYNRSSQAAREPWTYQSGGPHAEEIQRRCLTAALKAMQADGTVVGAFLWKWFPGQTQRGNFLMSTTAMQEVIRARWGTSE